MRKRRREAKQQWLKEKGKEEKEGTETSKSMEDEPACLKYTETQRFTLKGAMLERCVSVHQNYEQSVKQWVACSSTDYIARSLARVLIRKRYVPVNVTNFL